MIYLDHNATTPLLPEVVDAMLPYLREHFGNPSSAHPIGARAKQAVEGARGELALLLGCDAEEIVFTSGGTEANNLAIFGACEVRPEQRTIITTAIEHPATARPCEWLERRGYRVHRLPSDGTGRARLDTAKDALGQDTALLTVMHSNNETGVLQPVEELSHLAREVGAVVHSDAAQSVGKVPLSVDALGVDLLSVAGHKLYAPKGVGALYVRRGTHLAPFALGAGHEGGLRPGTENVASIVGLGCAAAIARRDLAEVAARVAALRDRLWLALSREVPGIARNGHGERVLPNTLNVRFPRVSGNAILARAPQLAASTGSACHDGHDAASAVILALGVPAHEALGSVRLTLGRHTTAAEIEQAATALISAWRGLGARP